MSINNKKITAILQCSSGIIPSVTGICLNGSNNNCYLVSSDSSYDNKIVMSTDGVNWNSIVISNINSSIIYHWNAICWSPSLTDQCLCAVGNNGYVMTSSSAGLNWSVSRLGDGSLNFDMVYWSTTDNKYYALDTYSMKKAVSSDGYSWIISTITTTEFNELNKKHFTYSWNVSAALQSTTDKVNVDGTGNTYPLSSWFDNIQGPFAVIDNSSTEQNDYVLLYYDNKDQFSVIYPNSANKSVNVILQSESALKDYDISYYSIAVQLKCGEYQESTNTLYAIDSSNYMSRTTDGYEWKNLGKVSTVSGAITDVAWSNTLKTFVVMTSTGENSSSSSGYAWTFGNSIPASTATALKPYWSKLAWSTSLGCYMCVSSDPYPYIAKSTDGRNWRIDYIESTHKAYGFSDIVWLDGLSCFIAISNNSNNIFICRDGLTWTPIEIDTALNGFTSICWDSNTHQLLMTSNNRICIYKSPDGINWTTIPMPITDDWYCVTTLKYKNTTAIFGSRAIVYTDDTDSKEYQIVDNAIDATSNIEVHELINEYKSVVINRNNTDVHMMHLKSGLIAANTLDKRPKWLTARYIMNDATNLISNGDFKNNDSSAWTTVGNTVKNIVFNRDIMSNCIRITNRDDNATSTSDLGLCTVDNITVSANSTYRCFVDILASNSNGRVYVYGSDGSVLKRSETISSKMSTIELNFVTLTYTGIKIGIKFNTPSYDDKIVFSNVRLVAVDCTLTDSSQFQNDATAYNYDIDYSGILSNNAVTLLGSNSSYIEMKQPFNLNDSMSMMFWLKINAIDPDNEKTIIYSGTKDSNFKVYIKNTSGVYTLTAWLLDEELDSKFEMSTGTWYHVGWSYNLKKFDFYIDGALVSTHSKMIEDFSDFNYTDSSYFSRIGNLAQTNSNNSMISVWDGATRTTDWYLESEDKIYHLTRASDLAGFATLVNAGNDFTNHVVSLDVDIDLNEYEWTPIGFYDCVDPENSIAFKGIFNGNGHTISNLVITQNASYNPTTSTLPGDGANIALFGYVSGYEVSTDVVSVSTITSAIVEGKIKSYFDPSTNYPYITTYNVAGIVAKGNRCKITDCTFNGEIVGKWNTAGIMAECSNKSEITNCTNNSVIASDKGLIGGISAYTDSSSIINCSNNGTISLTTDIVNNAVAGIVAYFYGGDLIEDTYYEVSNCTNNANITLNTVTDGIKNISCAGIVGQIDNLDAETRVQGCQNVGNITGIASIGGIVGKVLSNESNLNVYESINFGTITSVNDLINSMDGITGLRDFGGIIGLVDTYNTDYIEIYDCINVGQVNKAENAGGIVGRNKSKTKISKCLNTVMINNAYVTGGILGKLAGTCSLNNNFNIGKAYPKSCSFPTYYGAIVANVSSLGSLKDSYYNMFLTGSVGNDRIYDDYTHAVSKTSDELKSTDILSYINTGVSNATGHKMDYTSANTIVLDYNSYEVLSITSIYTADDVNGVLIKDVIFDTDYYTLSGNSIVWLYPTTNNHPTGIYYVDFEYNYNDTLYTFDYNTDAQNYISLPLTYPIPNGALTTINLGLNSESSSTNTSEYGSLSGSICDLRIYDYALSHRMFKELSKGQIVQYKSLHKAEANANVIVTDEGTYNINNMSVANGGGVDISPVISRVSEDFNIYGTKAIKIVFKAGSRASVNELNSRVIIDNITLLDSSADTDYTFSVYINDFNNNVNSANINKLQFKMIVDDSIIDLNDSTINLVDSGETMGTGSKLYKRYSVTSNKMSERLAAAKQIICLKPDSLGPTDANILENDFTIYLVAPQLENKSEMSEFMTVDSNAILYDTSTYNKNITLDISTSPIYVEKSSTYIDNHSYKMDPFKSITIPKEYVKNTDSFTVSFWLKTSSANYTGYSEDRHIIGRSQSFFTNGRGWMIGIDKTNNDVMFNAQTDLANKSVRFYYKSATEGWNQYVAVYDKGNMYAYLNGVLMSFSDTAFEYAPNVEDIIIGSKFADASTTAEVDLTNSMRGDLIRDIRIFGKALDADTVFDAFQASGISDDMGLLHAYTFRIIDDDNPNIAFEENGLTAKDWFVDNNISDYLRDYWPLCGTSHNYSDNYDNIMYVSDVTIDSGVKNSRSLRLNGVTSYILSKKKVTLSDISQFTLLFWLKTAAGADGDMCLLEYGANDIDMFSIYCSDGYLKFTDIDTTGASHSLVSEKVINDGDWHQIAILITRGKSISFMIDGVQDLSLNNYFTAAAGDTVSIFEPIWNLEKTYNMPIESISESTDYNITGIVNDEIAYDIPKTGDSENITNIDIFNSNYGVLDTCLADDNDNNIVYISYHDYNIGNSYIFKYDLSTETKEILCDSYYCSVMAIKNHKLFVTDRHEATDNTYTTYYVKSYDLVTKVIEEYPCNHNSIITRIAVDSNNTVYTSSYDDNVKRTATTGIIWKYSTYNVWINDMILSNDEEYLLICDKNKMLRKISKNGEAIWNYADKEDYETKAIAESNDYIYAAICQPTQTTVEDGGDIFYTINNKLIKINKQVSVSVTSSLDASGAYVNKKPDSNAIYVTCTDGEFSRINEIAIIPFTNKMLYIGASNTSKDYYKGHIQDVKIFSKLLSAIEVKRQYELFNNAMNKPMQIDAYNNVYVYHDITEID